MLEGLFKTQIKNVVETNIGGLVGKISFTPTLNFSPKVTLYVASQPKTPASPSDKNQASTDGSAGPKISSKKKIIHVDNKKFEIVEPTQEKMFGFELTSGRDIVIALGEDSGSKNAIPKPNKKAVENLRDGLPKKYKFECRYEPEFPLNSNGIKANGENNNSDIRHVGVFLLTISSDEFGPENFILLPEAESPATKTEQEGKDASVNTETGNRVLPDVGDLSVEERSIVISNKIANGRQEVKQVFSLDWPPQKLGEGSFGAVYAGRDHDDRRVAIKILYQRQFSTTSGLIAVDGQTYDMLRSGQTSSSTKRNQNKKVSHISVADLFDSIFEGLKAKAGKTKEGLSAEEVEELGARAKLLLSQSMNLSDLARHRFEHESLVDQVVRRNLEEKDISVGKSRYVAVSGFTDNFRSTKAYKALEKFHNTVGSGNSLNYSNYAIIMEFCRFTLKDLLERSTFVEVPENGNTKNEVGASECRDPVPLPELLGYEMMKRLSYESRSKIALPYLKGVANALQTIHLADRMHHDIKPGNIFVNSGPGELDVLLGDFSFVGALEEPGSNEAALKDFVGIGEMHYRSPEQNDFMEVMQASIVYEKPDYSNTPKDVKAPPEAVLREINGDHCFYLRVRDPKFEESLIRVDDKVVINSDQTGTVYPINYVRKERSHWDIWIDVPGETLRGRFLETPKAHVVFFKLPTRKTDLFGLGGLAYEMLTAGGSPARFYEKFRAVDQVGAPHSVDDLVRFFRESVESNKDLARQPAIKNLLSVFRGDKNGDNAPVWIVEFILKCMSFNLRGSYYWSLENEKNDFERTYGVETDDRKNTVAVESSAPSRILGDLLNSLQVKEDDSNFLVNPTRSIYLEEVKRELQREAVLQSDASEKNHSILSSLRDKLGIG